MGQVSQGATPAAAQAAEPRENGQSTYGPQATKLMLAQPLNPLVKLKFETHPKRAKEYGK